MEQENGGNTLTPPPPPEVSSSVKRKRGRPRKEQSEKRAKKSRTAEPAAVSNNDGVGQEVTGVVNAVFDAGYLITVRIGNAGTAYSGVVFKPGNYIPISPEIDLAPNVQMIRRNEILTERNHRGRRPKQRYGDEDDEESVPVTVRDYRGELRNGERQFGGEAKEAYNNDDNVVVAGGGKSEETEDEEDEEDDDNSDTVSAEPLQIVHSDSISSRSSNMGRMCELLQRENEEGDGDDEKKKKK
ncbi:uncharacterized protein LOC124946135 isoform X2 [Impatiens glandulifera]|uniref:uncharacterized protein LOC124946135 isoform X2 n=1 Tax=Impatiens glandulifera TaxID=253017 RepID=UPI001FB17CA0|nr:uncharacterized protein LOC124946135 isoform X2 [Impatiens glandulifera]